MSIQAVNNGKVADQLLSTQPQAHKPNEKSGPVSQPLGKTTPKKAGEIAPVSAGVSAKPPVATSASGGSSSPRIYDKRDLNKDGLVSQQEKAKYALKHPTVGGNNSPAVSSSQMKQGLSAYQQTQDNANETKPNAK